MNACSIRGRKLKRNERRGGAGHRWSSIWIHGQARPGNRRARRHDDVVPFVWRESGCESDFIVWRDRILWCDRFYEDNVEPPYDAGLAEQVLAHLDDKSFKNAVEVADLMAEIPWEVLRCCRKLSGAVASKRARSSETTFPASLKRAMALLSYHRFVQKVSFRERGQT